MTDRTRLLGPLADWLDENQPATNGSARQAASGPAPHPDDPGPTDPALPAGLRAGQKSGPPTNTPRAKAYIAADLAPSPPTRWIARGWLPRSAVAVLIGEEGLGKSLFWVIVVARITTGRGFGAIGMPRRAPCSVVVIVTEDSKGEVEARLQLAGADLRLVHFVARSEDLAEPPVFPDDMPVVDSTVTATHAVMCVVDAWLDTVDPNLNVRNVQHARQAIGPWRTLANRTGAAVLLLGNTNRLGGEASLRDRVGATASLRQSARMLLYAGIATDDDRGRLLFIGPDKSNVGRLEDAHRFTITVRQVRDPTEDDIGTVPLLEPGGAGGGTIAALTREWAREAERARRAQQAADRPPTKSDQARRRLLVLFHEAGWKPIPADEIQGALAADGYGKDAITTAKRALRIRSKQLSTGWVWEPPANREDPGDDD